jgi:uncharacterized membrane protein
MSFSHEKVETSNWLMIVLILLVVAVVIILVRLIQGRGTL